MIKSYYIETSKQIFNGYPIGSHLNFTFIRSVILETINGSPMKLTREMDQKETRIQPMD
jgi:hypothetical protein